MNASTRDAPSVHSLNYFVLSVPDLTVAREFYGSFGLDVKQVNGRLELRTFSTNHKWAEIVESRDQSKRFEYLSFGCYQNEFDQLAVFLTARGLVTGRPHSLATPEGIWLKHPDGYPIQIVVAEKTMPDHDATPSITPALGLRGTVAPSRCLVDRTRPRRLSHVLLFSSDVLRALAFFESALGLRLSDRSGDGIAFMHGIHGSDHHIVAIAKSSGPGFHHASWDVASLDEVGNGMEQMAKAGYAQGWGVGRHVLGSNYFYYVRDPWGSYSEYSFDIDYVPKGHEWPSKDHAPEDSFYMWGPPVPADFVTNYELQGVS